MNGCSRRVQRVVGRVRSHLNKEISIRTTAWLLPLLQLLFDNLIDPYIMISGFCSKRKSLNEIL